MNINLKTLPIVIVGLASQESRWGEIERMMEGLTLSNFRIHSFDEQRSCLNCRKSYISVLEGITQFPALILENDARPTVHFSHDIKIPDDAGVVYLGVHKCGSTVKGLRFGLHKSLHEPTADPDFFRPLNMLTTHAVLYVTSQARDEMLEILRTDHSEHPHDVAICAAQPFHRFIARRQPLFYQNDRHAEDTNMELKNDGQWSRIVPNTEPRKIYLVSFADSKYVKTLTRFRGEAEAMGVFEDIFCWSESDLCPEFFSRHQEFIDKNPRGYGYWIWKAQVVKQALRMIPDGSILFYADAGCVLNVEAVPRLIEYCDMLEKHPSKRLAFRLTPRHTEERWTKKHTLKELDPTGSLQLSDAQLVGGIFGLKKTEPNIEFIDRFSKESQRYDLIDDTQPVPNETCFKENRHDQSVWSILNKMADPKPLILQDETDRPGPFPFSARRLKF